MPAFNFELPTLQQEDFTSKDSVRKIMNLFYQLNEQLKYTLNNLDEENITSTILKSSGSTSGATVNIPAVTKGLIFKYLKEQYGYTADITVTGVNTLTKKAEYYLTGNTADIDFILLNQDTLRFMTAIKAEGEEQLEYEGKQYYWSDANHTAMSTSITSYPVIVYRYNNRINFAINKDGGKKILTSAFTAEDAEDATPGTLFIQKDTSNGIACTYGTCYPVTNIWIYEG